MTDALSLPTFTVAAMRLLRRVILVSESGVIERVFYPIFPPNKHPADVLSYLRAATPDSLGESRADALGLPSAPHPPFGHLLPSGGEGWDEGTSACSISATQIKS